MATKEMKFSYLRLYSDDSGETHLEDEEMLMTEAEYAPPAPPNWVGPREKATGWTVIGLPSGWFGDFHPVPRPQWMLIMSGVVEVEVTDGTKRTCPAGTIAFLEDAGSKGHISRSVGDELSVIMVVEVP